MPPPLLIRADASAEIGTGHVMRMLALAQAWQDRYGSKGVGEYGSDVLFICALLPEALEERLKQEGCDVVRIAATPGSREDLEQTLASSSLPHPHTPIPPHPHTPIPPYWFVADGYPFDLTYQRAIRAAGFKLLVVDDYNHLPEYDCDILLNQNIGAENYPYRVNADATRLMGPRYALLRREFREALKCSNHWKNRAVEVPMTGKNILVTMGGADTHNVTLKVIEALNQSGIEGLEVNVLVGAANEHIASLETAIQLTHSPISYHLIFQSSNIPSLMAQADLAVVSASSTVWELMAMGVPLITTVLADNQERIGEHLQARGLAVNLGWYHAWSENRFIEAFASLLRDRERRARMIEAGCELVDGEGAEKALMAMSSGCVQLRPAVMEDARRLWRWANDSETRAASFLSDEIMWDDHVRWLKGRLDDAKSRIYVANSGGVPVGVIRFERGENGSAVISVTVAPSARGHGMGRHLIEQGTQIYAAGTGCSAIHAYIRPGNDRSSRAFVRAGYHRAEETTVRDQRALHYIWRKDV